MTIERFPSATELRNKYIDWLSELSKNDLVQIISDTTPDAELSIWWRHRDKKNERNPFKEGS